MGRNPISYIALTAVCLVLLTGCNKSPSPEPTQAPVPPTEVAATLPPPKPTALPTPTETPPIACTIAFDSDREGNFDIFTMAPDGSDLINLSNNPGEDSNPSWSPDGSQIAFVSNRDAGEEGGQAIYVMNADGSGVRQLTFNHWSNSPDWSHDGSQITYSSDDDIFIIHADGSGQPVNLTNSPEKDDQPAWSPDGSKIAWISGGQDNQNLFVMNSDGTNQQKLTHNGKVIHVQWTVDGQIFSNWEHPDGVCTKCVMNADGSNIMEAGGKGELQRYLPFKTLDGNRVECISGNYNSPDEEILLVGEIFPDIFFNLTNNPANDRNPDWPANCLSGFKEVSLEASIVQGTEPAPLEELVFGYTGGQDGIDKFYEKELLSACEELRINCLKGENIHQLTGQDLDVILAFFDPWKVDQNYDQIHEAVSKGILTIILNAETAETGAYNLSIDTDATKQTIELMIKEIEGKGKIILFNFDDNKTQQEIISSILKENTAIESQIISGSFDGSSTSEEKLKGLVNANPNLKAIWTNNRVSDFFWPVKDVPNNPIPMMLVEPKLEMWDFWRDLISQDRGFKGFAAIKPGGTGYEGVYAAYYILNGEKVRPDALGGLHGNTLIYDYPLITNENLNAWIGKSGNLRENAWGELEIPPMTPKQIKEQWFAD
jgi:hypothetical protein